MGRYIWEKFCRLLCLIFVIWFICSRFGIDLIDWSGLETIFIAAAPSAIIFAAIIYVVISAFRK